MMGLASKPNVEKATAATTATANKTNSDCSKRSKLTSRFQDCVRKIKELCSPVETTTTHYYHHFRRWKNSKHSYKLTESLPQVDKEVVIIPEKREEKEMEYENDLKRMLSLRKIKHTDPQQYKMGCLMLKWYFESKNKESTNLGVNGREIGELEWNDQSKFSTTIKQRQPQDNRLYINHSAFKPALEVKSNDNLKMSSLQDGSIPRKSKFRPLQKRHAQSQGPIELKIGSDKGTANEKILKDLVHMIDDYLGDTGTISTTALCGAA